MSDLVGNPNCWFSHAHAKNLIVSTAAPSIFKSFHGAARPKMSGLTCAQMEAVQNEALVVNDGGAEDHWQEGEETQSEFHLVYKLHVLL